jgi:HlyD family secretion protein
MQVEASIVEADVSRFRVGQPVTFTVDAYPNRLFTGTVKQIRKAPKSIQNIVTYVVVIGTENPDEVLLPGMTANLQVVVAKRVGILKVPNMALRFRPRGQPEEVGAEAGTISATVPEAGRVFVLDEKGQPTPVTLRLGITDGRATEVLAGDLKEGQLVITATASPQSAPDAASFNFRLR